MNHSAVVGSRCDACHNGAYTAQGTVGAFGTAQYPNHVPTSGQDCTTCHATAASSYISWAGAVFVHQAGDTNCSNCHNGVMALGKTTPPHLPVGAVQCSNCHTSAAASFTTYSMNHAAVSGSRCDSCHNGPYVNEGTAGAQSSSSFPNHVATGGRDCITCHSNAAASFTTWAGAKYVHSAADTNCSTCHNGSTATGMVTPPHVPSGNVECGNCHSNTAASFATYTMNHVAVGVVRCDACHSGAYTGEGTKGALGIASYPGHVPTAGRDCITCHASAAPAFTSFAGAVYVHQAGDTNCSSCHNGTTATGKATSHVPVGTVQCSNCHTNTAVSFATYTMNHAAVSANRCDSCHNGSYVGQGTKGALGNSSYPGHIPTNGQDCVACHAAAAASFVAWTGGVYTHQPIRHKLFELPQRNDGNRKFHAAAYPGLGDSVQQLPRQYSAELCHLYDEPRGGEREPLRCLSQRLVHRAGHQGRSRNDSVSRSRFHGRSRLLHLPCKFDDEFCELGRRLLSACRLGYQLCVLSQRADGDRHDDAAAHSDRLDPVQQLPQQFRRKLRDIHDEPCRGQRDAL